MGSEAKKTWPRQVEARSGRAGFARLSAKGKPVGTLVASSSVPRAAVELRSHIQHASEVYSE